MAGRAARPRLLLVDDDAKWAKYFAAGLAHLGLDVTTSNDGPSVVRLTQDRPADVILLDERMPGVAGHEVCRRLRSDGYRGAILIYSAYDSISDIVLAHEAEADDHVWTWCGCSRQLACS